MQTAKMQAKKLYYSSDDRYAERVINALLNLADQKYGIDEFQEIGEGEYSVVFSARELRNDRSVAIKCLIGRGFEEILQWFEEKSAAMRLIKCCPHPNIVQTYEYYPFPDIAKSALLVMELVNGESLAEVLPKIVPGDWHNQKIIDTFIQVCTALEWAHGHSILHGDLKPSNLLFHSRWEDAAEPFVKVTDFGRMGQVSSSAQEMMWDGRPLVDYWYRSPEQRLYGKVDARTDIYALGCIMFEAYSGCRLSETYQQGNFFDLSVYWHHLTLHGDPGLGNIFLKASKFEPDARYQSVRELKDDLMRLKSTFSQSPSAVQHTDRCAILNPRRRTVVKTGTQPFLESDTIRSTAGALQSLAQRVSIFAALPSIPLLCTFTLATCISAMFSISFILGVSPLVVLEILLTPHRS